MRLSHTASWSCAFIGIALAIGARLLLDPVLGSQYPFATVSLAVIVTAWYGGLRPSLLAVVLGAIASDFFLLPPRLGFHLAGADEKTGMILYLITGFGISLLAGSMHNARERAEAEVESQTAELRNQALILDLAHDAVFIRDDRDRVAYWNQGAQRLYGWSREEALGHVTHSLLSTQFPQPLGEIRAQLFASGSWHGELLHTRRDGSLVTVASSWTLQRETAARPVSVIELNHDITARQKAERELEKSQAQLLAIFEHSRDGIIVYEAIRDEAGALRDFRFAMINPAAERLARLDAPGLIGQTLLDKFPGVGPDGLFDKFAGVVAGGADIEIEYFYRGDEISRWYRMTAAKLGDGLVLNYNDITSRKLAEDRRRLVAERLGVATEALHAGVFEWNIRNDSVEWDDRMREIYGLAGDVAVTYAVWASLVLPDDLPGAVAVHDDVIARKSQATVEFRIRRRDGSLRHIQSSCGTALDDSGQVTRVIGVSIDVTERRKTEERFQLVVEAAPNAMIMVGGDGLITLVNSQTEKLFAYGRTELLGQPLDMLIPERFRASHAAHVSAYFAAPTTRAPAARQKLFGLRRDGSEVPLEIGLNPVETADGHFVLASILDITERKRTEERLQLLAAIVDGAKDYASFMLDPEGYVLTWNEGAKRIKGYSEEEIVGQHFSCFYTPEDVDAGHPADELRIARAVGRFEEEGWRVRRDGSKFWASVLVTAIHDKDGRLQGFSKLTRDITERRRTEERFQRVVEASPSALIMVGAGGLITLVNTRTEKLFGYDRHELLGRHIEMLVPERFRAGHAGQRLAFFAAPSARMMGAGRDLFGLRKDGSEMPVEIGLNPIVTSDGAFVLASVIDITWRKRVESELRARTAEMERFTYTVSHDLKSPLITIKSYIAMIDRDLAAGNFELARPDLQRVAKAADKMHNLLEEVLKLSRVGRVETTREKVPFGALAAEALELAAGRIREKNIHVEIGPGLPSVTVDRTRIVEVLQNLLDNAAKFTGGQMEPRIQIGAAGEGAEMRFFVKDNGCGIDPKYHERIFGLFDKLDAKSEGSGAGLAIVRRIIETHGGRIWVESPGVGGGSTFWFTLKERRATPRGPTENMAENMAEKQ